MTATYTCPNCDGARVVEVEQYEWDEDGQDEVYAGLGTAECGDCLGEGVLVDDPAADAAHSQQIRDDKILAHLANTDVHGTGCPGFCPLGQDAVRAHHAPGGDHQMICAYQERCTPY